VPEGWILLQPGDAALTRRVKAAGDHWVVQERKGRKVFSQGVWAPAATIERIRADLVTERSTDGFAKKKAADARRREGSWATRLGETIRVGAEELSSLKTIAFKPRKKEMPPEGTLKALRRLR